MKDEGVIGFLGVLDATYQDEFSTTLPSTPNRQRFTDLPARAGPRSSRPPFRHFLELLASLGLAQAVPLRSLVAFLPKPGMHSVCGTRQPEPKPPFRSRFFSVLKRVSSKSWPIFLRG
jgi:hypothetical protein